MLALAPPISPADRDLSLDLLAGRRWDLVVVGAGISGVAVARDAALRGLSVAVVEASDIAFGTSSRSSRLVHGGLRYLASLELSLVREGVVERARLLDNAPDLVRAERFLYLVYCADPDSLWKIRLGVRLYGLLAAGRRLGRSAKVTTRRLKELLPGIETDCLDGAVGYYDASTHDARLTLAVSLAAHELGVPVVTRCRAEELTGQGGRTNGLVVDDTIADRRLEVHARAVVLCTGPWQTLHADVKPHIRTARGTHVSVPASRLPLPFHLAMRSPDDGRQTFALPCGDYTILGTTDTDDDTSPGRVAPTTGDTDYLLAVANQVFPDADLERRDVVGAWAGLRPLVADGSARSPDALSRRHRVVRVAPGRWVLAGGKLTTHRRMAEDLLDAVIEAEDFGDRRLRACSTRRRPLFTTRADAGREQLQRYKADAATIERLAALYGGRLGRLTACLGRVEPVALDERIALAQAKLAVEEEGALALDDVLLRRMDPGPLDLERCLRLARPVAAEIAGPLGWSRAQMEAQVEAFRDAAKSDLLAARGEIPRPATD